ncbi:hypothetical protein [Terasakiella sp. SH-1]|uniref:hypothetical protein n=1 Tax=Terasakiella sp. SH-1 TaxID=2560057 RepID=UPI0010738BCC|nr:hypothetical protein [Terasakiella sp. SH-1]
MSSVTKPIAASTSPVASSRAGSSVRQVASQFGAVSELYAQSGVRGDDENRNLDDFNGKGQQQQRHEQPHTLKLHGTSRTFAMLFEDSQQGSSVGEDGYVGDGTGTGKPAFQAYMERATSTYDLSTRAVNGELKVRGGSLNIAM